MRIALISDTHYGFSEKTAAKILATLSKMKKDKPDVILHAGDWASMEHQEFVACVELFRKKFPNTPIVGALGNHDFWDRPGEFRILEEAIIEKYVTFFQNGIKSEFHKDGVSIYALQTWYRTCHPPSSDATWMPMPLERANPHVNMINRMADDVKELRARVEENKDATTKILLTHFTHMNCRYGYTGMCGPQEVFDSLVQAGINIACLGHSHMSQDVTVDGCRFLNCGSDYDNPKYVIFEV